MSDSPTLTPHGYCGQCGEMIPLDADGKRASHERPSRSPYGGEGLHCYGSGGYVPPRLARDLDPANPVLPPSPYADPSIEFVSAADLGDSHFHQEALDKGRKRMQEGVPAHYRDAVVAVPEVREWVRALVRGVYEDTRTLPRIDDGKSLLLLGPTGTGKTWTAFGVARALCVCGVPAPWLFTTAADMYAALRPRARVDSEEEFERYTSAGVLLLDDLGAAKGTEWNEEINYRLINRRYSEHRPTFVTSNVPPAKLAEALGERVASRLTEMCERVVLKGADRRLNGPKAVAS